MVRRAALAVAFAGVTVAFPASASAAINLSGSIVRDSDSQITITVTNNGDTVSDVRVDLKGGIHHTGATATNNNTNATAPCGPYLASTTNLTCGPVTFTNGQTLKIVVTVDARYPDEAGADGYGDSGGGFIGPFAFTGPAAPAAPPTQPAPEQPQTPAGPAPPEAQKSVDAKPVNGRIRVQKPGSATFEDLSADTNIPVGSTVDATSGTVEIVVSDGKGGTSTAQVYGGIFKIVQRLEGGKLVTELQLVGGNFRACKAAAGRALAQLAGKVKSVRHLWVDAKGLFRTKGKYSSATIRGTKWLTDDRCDGTLTKVAIGAVTVRDFVKRKSVVVKAGKQYLAKA
jgi:hypothetical protein